jgi:hypothetical protein
MSTLDSLISESKSIQDKVGDLIHERNEISDKMLGEISSHIFEKYPWIESFGWNQYTPYFMDGDPCVFSANTDYININDQDDWEFESDEFNISEENAKNAFKEIKNLLALLTESFLLTKFGDHSEIKCTRKHGYTRYDFDHD